MRRFWPFFLIAGGVLMVVVGFAYDVWFAGIPYQDPTPELSARYAQHASIASTIRRGGVVVFLAGWVAAMRHHWPLFLVVGGVLLALGGFVFATTFAHIPREAGIVRVSAIVAGCGVVIFLLGGVAWRVRYLRQKAGRGR